MNVFSMFQTHPAQAARDSRVNHSYLQASEPSQYDHDEDCVIIEGVRLDRKKDAELISDYLIWSAPMM